MKTKIITSVLLILLFNVKISAQQIIAKSTFDTGNEGWAVSGASGPYYHSTGGNSGGYITGQDNNSDDWFFNAPSKFLGNVSNAYGTAISFDLIIWANSNLYVYDDIILEGNGKKLVIQLNDAPPLTWKHYVVNLNEGAGWKKDIATGSAPSADEFKAILSSLTRLSIRGEYQIGSDSCGIDNVILGGVPVLSTTVIITSNFDQNIDGWQIENAGSGPVLSAAGGNPSGFIYGEDSGSDDWYFKAPQKFLGNYSTAYGGILSFDLRQREDDNQYDFEDVVIEGAGLRLIFDTPTNPKITWTNYQVILLETAGWKKNNLSGSAPTATEFKSVLSSITKLLIRGEYRLGSDHCDLDNPAISKLVTDIRGTSKYELPYAFNLYQNYPNPFNPSTNISFSLPQRSNVKLVVYDVLGSEVATLANSVYETGKYVVKFNGNNLASGMYFYALITSQGMISKKMLLVK